MAETIERKLRVAAQARRRDGVVALIRLVGRSAADHVLRSRVERRRADFDRHHGVDTAGVIAAEELDHARGRHGDGFSYQTVPIHQTESIFRALASSAARPLSDFTFVDLGCGKGLPLMLAMRRGFGSATGVELDSGLAAKARQNARTFTARAGIADDTIEILEQDAAQFEFPERPTALFLFNPFGAGTLGAVLDRAAESVTRCPRPFFVAYYNTVHREVFDGHPAVRLVLRTVRWSLYAVEAPA
ncbi:methyltransferase domain-containing protein [Phytohabitans rumicis]|nr:methyltransferase domain-containing protein [Phytohabitans rumicis]